IFAAGLCVIFIRRPVTVRHVPSRTHMASIWYSGVFWQYTITHTTHSLVRGPTRTLRNSFENEPLDPRAAGFGGPKIPLRTRRNRMEAAEIARLFAHIPE